MSDSISSTATIDSTMLDSGSVDAYYGHLLGFVHLEGSIDTGGSKSFQLTIGQTSDTSHEYTRTVTIQLDDADYSKIYVLIHLNLFQLVLTFYSMPF